MNKYLKLLSMLLLISCAFLSCKNAATEEPTTGEKKTNCQISYEISANSVTSSDIPYSGELTDSQIGSIYKMALSTYGDPGLYRYVTFSDAKTEEQIKALAIEFGNKADNMVRSQHQIPSDVWPGYTKLICKVNYVFDGRIVQVAEYDYLK